MGERGRKGGRGRDGKVTHAGGAHDLDLKVDVAGVVEGRGPGEGRGAGLCTQARRDGVMCVLCCVFYVCPYHPMAHAE